MKGQSIFVPGCDLNLSCDFDPDARLEIQTRSGGPWVEVTPEVFRSWTGGRRVDGSLWAGKVWVYLTDDVAR